MKQATPRAAHEAHLERGFTDDPAQRAVLEHLERLFRELVAAERVPPWKRLLSVSGRGAAPVRGLYLWGGVGRGKTYLMDLFYECLPFAHKHRRHFHRFMHDVHAELKRLRQHQDPLSAVADKWAGRTKLLCFDEFFVSDIADAMILSNLLGALFERGVALVATSNIPPDALYRDGLQRARFLPAIELIKERCEVVAIGGDTDYRLRALERAEIYHSPLDEQADANLERCFDDVAPESGRRGGSIEVEGRVIPYRRQADCTIWFDFDAICGGPRSTRDYIEIARSFTTVLVSGIPVLDEARENEARRLIALTDEFYDRNVKLIASAAAPVDEIYRGRRLQSEFQRTRSRLQEMQSHDYLARPHKP